MSKQRYLLLPAFLLLSLSACKPQPERTSSEQTEGSASTAKPAHTGDLDATKIPEVSGVRFPDPLQEAGALYVATDGNDAAVGTKDAPLKTLSVAVAKLSEGQGGTVFLRGGVYRKPLSLPENKSAVEPLLIAAAPGERVVFEGGTPITRWERYGDKPGLYLIHAPNRETALSQTNYFEVWENEARVRYRKVADEAGVETWPGSVCLLDGDRLLVHIPEGRTPAEAALWHNQRADGASIYRSRVKLHGITFQNFLGGGEARAMTISRGEDIHVSHCTFVNNTIAISNSAHRTVIADSHFLEAGLGVRFSGQGTDMTVRRCLMESAMGRFAFSDLGEHVRNGIRIYHAGDGATVEQCVTAGFWAGLYIKTVTHRDGSRPVLVRNNTFIDTFRGGADHRQPRTTVERNIIGPYVEESGVAPNGAYLRKMGASVSGNYYFGHTGAAHEGEGNGPDPFVNLAAGDLHLRPSLPLPISADELGATEMRQVTWNARLTASFQHSAAEAPELAMVGTPSVAASKAGALIGVAFSNPTPVQLFYRKVGMEAWVSEEGVRNTVVRPASMAASTPTDPEVINEWSTLFVLLRGKLEPDQHYEYRLETGGDKDRKVWHTGKFSTSSETKVIHVAANASEGGADGSAQAPFPKIQQALDRALPGDRVEIAGGVYTDPLLLQHGGASDAPITIAGSGMRTTILDGGKQVGTMLELRNAPDVNISGLQIRWFANRGVSVQGSPRGKLVDCWVWNQALFPRITGISGLGVVIDQSPGWQITGCIFNRMEHGILAIRSPRIQARNNTAYGNIYAGIALVQSARDSVVTHNSLNFTGNVSYHIREDSPVAFASLVSDYNNFGNRLRVAKEIDQGGTVRVVEGIRPENDFAPAERYGAVTESKFVIETWIEKKSDIFLKMGDWRGFSSKDQNSIYADPEFVNPVKGDFRILPNSPNRLPDGTLIGAGDVLSN